MRALGPFGLGYSCILAGTFLSGVGDGRIWAVLDTPGLGWRNGSLDKDQGGGFGRCFGGGMLTCTGVNSCLGVYNDIILVLFPMSSARFCSRGRRLEAWWLPGMSHAGEWHFARNSRLQGTNSTGQQAKLRSS